MRPHHGRVAQTLLDGLRSLNLPEKTAVCVTGGNRHAVLALCPQLTQMEDIPAIVSGVRTLAPSAGSVIEIGSQSARFITELHAKRRAFRSTSTVQAVQFVL